MSGCVHLAFAVSPAPGPSLAKSPLGGSGPAARQPLEELCFNPLAVELRTVKNEMERGFNLCCPDCRYVHFVVAEEIVEQLPYAYSGHRQPASARIQFSGAFARLFAPEACRRVTPLIAALLAFTAGLAVGVHPLVSGWLALMVGMGGGLWISRALVEPLLRLVMAERMPIFLIPCPHCQQTAAVATDGKAFFLGAPGR